MTRDVAVSRASETDVSTTVVVRGVQVQSFY